MTTEQLMFAALSVQMGILGFFIRGWMNSVKESFKENKETFEKINKRLDNMDKEKVEVKWCDRLHEGDRRRNHSLARETAT